MPGARKKQCVVPEFCPPFSIERVVIAGDVHGDILVLEGQLRAGGVATMEFNDDGEWTGECAWIAPKGTVMVFLGDVVDGRRDDMLMHQRVWFHTKPGKDARKIRVLARDAKDDVGYPCVVQTHEELKTYKETEEPVLHARIVQAEPPGHANEYPGEELHIVQAIAKLSKQARRLGSAVVFVVGNHEAWMCHGDTTYATAMSLGCYARADQRVRALSAQLHAVGELYSVVRVGPWVFAHAGVVEEFLNKFASVAGGKGNTDRDALLACNQFVRRMIETAARGGSSAVKRLAKNRDHVHVAKLMWDRSAPWLTRKHSDTETTPSLSAARKLFRRLGMDPETDHMAMGHSVQSFRQENRHYQYTKLLVSAQSAREGVLVYGGKGNLERATHGINFALPQEGGETGMFFFLDVGSSRAFDYKPQVTDKKRFWARSPQVLLWSRRSGGGGGHKDRSVVHVARAIAR